MSNERPHHPYSPSTLQMREACPLWWGTGETTEAAETGTRQHRVTETREDDPTLTDEQAFHAAECLDYSEQLKQSHQANGHTVEELTEVYVRIDDRKRTVPVFDPATFSMATRPVDTTTGGYVDRVLLVEEAKHIEVLDWKFGYWPVSDAHENLQGISYVLGLFRDYPWAETIQLHFKLPKIKQVTSHTFRRSEFDELYLKIATVVDTAVEANRTEDYSKAKMFVPCCLFCGRRGQCHKLQEIMIKVGQKYLPLEFTEDFNVTALRDPKNFPIGMRLAQAAKAWADGFRRQGTNQVIMGLAPVPDGFRLENFSEREIVDLTKVRRAALDFMTDEAYAATLKPTLGALEKAVAANVPRGQKELTVKQFSEKLLESGAVKKTTPKPFLKAVPKKDPNRSADANTDGEV